MTPLAEQIARHEGKVINGKGRHVVYDDATGKPIGPGSTVVGHPTLGYGRNVEGLGISDDEAVLLLTNSLDMVRTELDKSIPWWTTLSEPRRDVLVNMGYNMGVATLLTFAQTLDYVKNAQYDLAADQMLKSKWAQQVTGRAVELATQMRTGQWSVEV